MISSMPDYLPVLTIARSSIEPSDAVYNGPILLTTDSTTPEVLYLTSPGSSAIKLVINGGNEKSTWDLLDPPSSGTSLFSFTAAAITLVSIVLSIL